MSTPGRVRRTASQLLPDGVRLWLGYRLDRLRSRRFDRRWVRQRYGGIDLDVLIADPMGDHWYRSEMPEPPELDVLRRSRLGPGARVFDCGAHHGVVAAMLAHAAPGGEVVAIEADAHNIEIAKAIVERNALDNVRLVHAAVAATQGVLRFTGRLNGALHPKGPVRVRSTTVDDLTATYGPPDVVYIDVEGYELDVLRGAEQTLSAKPDLMIEVHVGCGLEMAGETAEDVVQHVGDLGYSCYVHNDHEQVVPIPVDQAPAVLQRRFFLTAIAS